MSEEKHTDNDPERTLLTLDQLSQTIEVMTSVVNRLRQHLSEQIQAQLEGSELDSTDLERQLNTTETEIAEVAAKTESPAPEAQDVKADVPQKRESFIVEINQPETDPVRKSTKTLH